MKLSELYPTLTTEERGALAKAAGILPGYLYQIATRWRGRKASLKVMRALAEADKRLSVKDMLAEFTAPSRESV